MNEEHKKALAKVKATVDIEGLEIALVTPRYYDAVYSFIAKEFIPDEPLGKALGLTWTKDVEATFRISLENNLSLMAVNENGEIVGVNVTDIVMSGKDRYLITNETSDNWRNWLEFLTQKESEVKFFERYSVSEAVHFFGLSTGRAVRRRGIAMNLIKAGILLGSELGYKAFMVEATSLYTKLICIKHGFEQLAILPYTNYPGNGEDLFKNRKEDEHKSTIIYGKKL